MSKPKANPKLEKNIFFDFSKLPPEKGLLIFGLSMNLLSNRQNAENCLTDLRHFTDTKLSKPLVGLNFLYSDFLYLYSEKSAPTLKESFMSQVINHKNSFQNILLKNSVEFQIPHAFNYMVWNQLYIGSNDFHVLLKEVKKIYSEDILFQKYLKEDCELFEKSLDENQISFFLEESLAFYLLTKNKIKLPNDYIENNQKWILFCYPGRPLKTTVYLYQLNPFKLDWPENPYQNCFYDLEAKQLIEYDRVDLESYTVKS